MKTITLAQAFAILENASAVIIDHADATVSLDQITGQGDNQFALLSWEDDEGLEYSTSFTEENNLAPQVNGSVLLLTDDEGEPTELTILMPANLEA